MITKKILVNVNNPKSDLRTKLTVPLIKEFRARIGQPLYFHLEDNIVVATIYPPQSKNLLFSIHVDGENRARLTEAQLKKLNAAFGDKLEFTFLGKDKAIVKVQKKQSEEKKQKDIPPGQFKNSESEKEQSSIEQSLKAGAGFGDPETNRKVERAAVSFVTQWYGSRGWNVTSVESEKRGYDLLCVKGADKEHVEVKGRQGDSPSFIITAGELREARNNPSFVICVVTSALRKNSKLHRYLGREFISRFDLSPIAFRAVLREIKND